MITEQEALRLKRAQNGDAAAFEEFVRENETTVYRLALRTLGSREDAEDAAQETFVKAWRSLSGFRHDCSEKTWLCHIAVNTCHSLRRGFWFRSVSTHAPEDLPEAAAEQAPGYDPTVWNAVQALQEPLKSSLILRYYEGLSLEETALALGTNVNTLNTRLRKARSILQAKLKGWYFDEDEGSEKSA